MYVLSEHAKHAPILMQGGSIHLLICGGVALLHAEDPRHGAAGVILRLGEINLQVGHALRQLRDLVL